MKTKDLVELSNIIIILSAVLKEVTGILDKLGKGEIDPKAVDIQKWNDTLSNLTDLTRKK